MVSKLLCVGCGRQGHHHFNLCPSLLLIRVGVYISRNGKSNVNAVLKFTRHHKYFLEPQSTMKVKFSLDVNQRIHRHHSPNVRMTTNDECQSEHESQSQQI